MCVSPTASDKIREIHTGDHFIKVLELRRNGDTVIRSTTKNDFIDSLAEYRLPLRDLRMLVKSSDTIRTRFPSLLPRPSSKCYIFEIEHIRFLCFRRVSLSKQFKQLFPVIPHEVILAQSFILFLAPTGAQGVTMCVRPSVRHNMLKSSLELSIFIFLVHRALRK